MKVLVTGGAGYIGSHVVRDLVDHGHEIVVFDNLSTGFRWSLPKTSKQSVELVVGDVVDRAAVDQVISTRKVQAVIHLAARTQVEESTREPLAYYETNTLGTIHLLTAMQKHGVEKLIFSSTAAVYGSSERPVCETDQLQPLNPYGRSKLMSEQVIEFHQRCHSNFRFVNLRYFNVAGAHPSGEIGQATPAATHLVKAAVEAALGRRPELQIYGRDYPTPDGTCVRDYIHVWDLARAHELVLQYLFAGGASDTFNLGYGRGFSVQEVATSVAQVSGQPLKISWAPRRAGDAAQVVANVDKLSRIIKFSPESSGALERICASALTFEKRRPG